jgi:hypothetical protein
LDIPPSELFLELCEPGPSEVIDFPRRKANGEAFAQIRIQVLDLDAHERARKNAHRALKQDGFSPDDYKDATIQEVAGDMVARELLAMACHTAKAVDLGDGKETYARVFRNADDLKKLRADEVAFLFNAYLLVQAKFGPFEKTISSPEDLNAWIKRLQEGGSEFPLLRLQLPRLVEVAFSLAERAYLLSAILESLWPTLPDTFKSRLDGCSMGIGFYGEHAADSTPGGGASSDDGPVTAGQVTKLQETLQGE